MGLYANGHRRGRLLRIYDRTLGATAVPERPPLSRGRGLSPSSSAAPTRGGAGQSLRESRGGSLPYHRTMDEAIARALEAADEPTCEAYFRALLHLRDDGLSEDARADGKVLLDLAALMLRPTEREPLSTRGIAGTPPETYDEARWNRLSELEDDLPLDLRARIADIRWSRTPGDAEAAAAAVNRYAKSAERLVRLPEKGVPAKDRLRRAASICGRRRDEQGYTALLDRIEQLLGDEEVPGPTKVHLVHLLLDVDEVRGARHVDLVRQAIEAHASDENGTPDWDWLRFAWKVVAQAERSRDGGDAAHDAEVAWAETFAEQADWLAGIESASAHLRVERLKKAIVELRRLGCRDRVNELEVKLREAQRQGRSEMRRIEGPSFDPSELARQAIDAVKGKSWQDAMLALATMAPSPSLERLREHARESSSQFPLQFLFGQELLDDEGRTVARRTGGWSPEQTVSDEALDGIVVESVGYHAAVTVHGFIEPARRQILVEQAPTMQDWADLVAPSPWCHPGRIWSWVKGLDAGLRGDFLVACHMLVPQMEGLFRGILRAHGVRTTYMRDDGIERERAVEWLLTQPELVDQLGQDAAFDLRCLLSRQDSFNLRNRLSHGMLDDAELYSTPAVYAWHMGLRLMLVPLGAHSGDSH